MSLNGTSENTVTLNSVAVTCRGDMGGLVASGKALIDQVVVHLVHAAFQGCGHAFVVASRVVRSDQLIQRKHDSQHHSTHGKAFAVCELLDLSTYGRRPSSVRPLHLYVDAVVPSEIITDAQLLAVLAYF